MARRLEPVEWKGGLIHSPSIPCSVLDVIFEVSVSRFEGLDRRNEAARRCPVSGGSIARFRTMFICVLGTFRSSISSCSVRMRGLVLSLGIYAVQTSSAKSNETPQMEDVSQR